MNVKEQWSPLPAYGQGLSLLTQRLRLRPITEADFEMFCSVLVDDPFVMRFYHSYARDLGPAERRQRARHDFFEHFREGIPRGYVAWVLESADPDVASSARFAGWCGLTTAALPDPALGPELQYMLARHAQGSGLATEASRAVLDDAFHRLKLPRVHAVVDAPNVPSRRVAEKSGFQFAGPVEVYGSADMVLYSLDADEWEGSQKRITGT